MLCLSVLLAYRCANVLLTNPIWVVVTRMQVCYYPLYSVCRLIFD